MKNKLSYALNKGIALFIPFIIMRSLRTNLSAIWAKGQWSALPKNGFIVAANHHSWWDVYLAFLLHKRFKRKISAMMDDSQLTTFAFFRHMGALGRKELRLAIRRLQRGDMFVILPEGELQQNGEVKHLEKGVVFLARAANAAIYPLAIRVVMRGAQYPEAFMVLGDKLECSNDEAKDLETLKCALNSLLSDIDNLVETTHPENDPEGFESWLSGKSSMSDRMRWLRRLWS